MSADSAVVFEMLLAILRVNKFESMDSYHGVEHWPQTQLRLGCCVCYGCGVLHSMLLYLSYDSPVPLLVNNCINRLPVNAFDLHEASIIKSGIVYIAQMASPTMCSSKQLSRSSSQAT